MKGFFLLLALSVAIYGFGQSSLDRTRNFNIRKEVAMEGYDPVSYFDGSPREGKPSLKYTYNGVPYLFYNAGNLNKFKANPVSYEPAYGGWCAYAMGESGDKVKIDPETYKIKDGKLYLFYNFWGNNTLEEWNKQEKELNIKADKHWSKYFHKQD